MLKRRRQAASPVSLLVVTLLFVWACSSGDHGDASVTTSGGAGSEGRAGSAANSATQGIEAPGDGGAIDPGTGASDDAAGSGGELNIVQASPSGGTSNAPSGTSGSPSAPLEADAGSGGTGGSTGGKPGSAGSSSAGHSGSGAAGAPFVAPTCDAVATSSSTAVLYLPCEVNSALYSCRACHGSPAAKPPGTTYISYADIKPRAAAIADMVRTGYMPRPPFKMSEQQKITVLTWLGKEGSCAVGVPNPCQ